MPDDVNTMVSQLAQTMTRISIDVIYVQADACVEEGVLSGCSMLQLNDATKDVEGNLDISLG
jgi:hypothetical protein